MITKEAALALVDPTLPEEQQLQSAQVLIASCAALDAYLDSRPQLEQIIARANGAGEIPSHAELNDSAKEAGAGNQSPPLSGSDSGRAALSGSLVEESEAEQELRAAKERVAQLEAAGK
jgi:hypothetical protein